MSHSQISHPLQDSNPQKQRVPKLPHANEVRIPELEFGTLNDGTNYQLQVCKLLQANTILSELIKDAVLQKYSLSEKIYVVLEQIRKLQSKNIAK